MRELARALIVLAVAVVFPACGGDEPPPGDGRLVVVKSLAGGPVFAEGSVTELRVTAQDGRIVVDELRPTDTLDVPVFSRALAPGRYAVRSVERPCSGNCAALDPPALGTRCDRAVTVATGRTTRLTIVLAPAADGARNRCSVVNP